MSEDKKAIDRIAEAKMRIRAWREERYDDLPAGYCHESIQFDVDLQTLEEASEVTCGILWLVSGKL
jgi:hypothetical protein